MILTMSLMTVLKTRVNRKRRGKQSEWVEKIPIYLPLYRATLEGNWEFAKAIVDRDFETVTAKITKDEQTILHIAVGTGRSIDFVRKLVSFMPVESLELRNGSGDTALGVAALIGNTKAAEILVKKNGRLPQMRNKYNKTPLHLAAKFGLKETVEYLLLVTKNESPSPFFGKDGAELLNLLIFHDFYGIALTLLDRYPKLALEKDHMRETALHCLARKPQAFESRSQLRFWQSFIYHFVPMKIVDTLPLTFWQGDIENPPYSSEYGVTHERRWHFILWNILRSLVPCVSTIHDAKLMHMQVSELVRVMCSQVLRADPQITADLFGPIVLKAAEFGVFEIVKEIIKIFPYSLWFKDFSGRNVFQIAILHRRERIFNLIYQMSPRHYLATVLDDKSFNNMNIFTVKFQPPRRISEPALYLQRELQISKEFEKVAGLSLKKEMKLRMETPSMMMAPPYNGQLVKEGEKWMKLTASRCMVVAAITAMIALAAAFTAHESNSITIFPVSDAVALFCSSTSVIIFLNILTSHYTMEDFHKSLPRRLIMGLITMFISVAAMMTVLSSSLHMVFVHKVKWDLIPIVTLAFIPVMLFAILQFPLLVKVTSCTYGRRVFRLQSKEKLY